MFVREEMPVEAILKGSAAKVLFHLLRHRGESLSNAAIMRGSGVRDRNTFFAAKKQLQELGLWNNPDGIFHTVGGNTQTVGVIPQTVGGNTQTEKPRWFIQPTPPTDAADGDVWIREGSTPRVRALPLEAEVIHPVAQDISLYAGHPLAGPPNFRAEAMQADLLPDDGDQLRPTSLWQARRRVQLGVLARAWMHLFSVEAAVGGLKRLLEGI